MKMGQISVILNLMGNYSKIIAPFSFLSSIIFFLFISFALFWFHFYLFFFLFVWSEKLFRLHNCLIDPYCCLAKKSSDNSTSTSHHTNNSTTSTNHSKKTVDVEFVSDTFQTTEKDLEEVKAGMKILGIDTLVKQQGTDGKSFIFTLLIWEVRFAHKWSTLKTHFYIRTRTINQTIYFPCSRNSLIGWLSEMKAIKYG